MSKLQEYRSLAYERGKQEALKAASWVIDGNTSQEHIHRMVVWFDNDDPRRDDYLPQRPNLSGEWANDLTPNQLFEETAGREFNFGIGAMDDDALLDDMCEAFEEGVADHFEPECERILKQALND